MNILSVLGLKVLNFIIGLLPDFVVEIPVIENVSQVLNIFAWVNFFLPTTLIAALLAILTAYYGFRIVYNIIVSTKDLLL